MPKRIRRLVDNLRALMVTDVDLDENEGIYKKIISEAIALKDICGDAALIYKRGSGCVYQEFSEDNLICIENSSPCKFAIDALSDSSFGLLYVRHMRPSFSLLKMLNFAKRNSVKIVYEIPTYPFFYEQFKVSKNAIRGSVKIGLEIIFWPFIYQLIDVLIVIRSKQSSHRFKKMIDITNGYSNSEISTKRKERLSGHPIRLAAVGTLYPYHGYDRIINGLADCNENFNGRPIEFHVIGSSATTDHLKDLSKELGLSKVFFHGVKNTNDLNVMFEDLDIGLGCMALHRRNADIDTSLKIIEYYYRGVPVVTSGKPPMPEFQKYTVVVSDKEDAIDIPNMIAECLKIEGSSAQISELAKASFNWSNILKRAFMECGLFEHSK